MSTGTGIQTLYPADQRYPHGVTRQMEPVPLPHQVLPDPLTKPMLLDRNQAYDLMARMTALIFLPFGPLAEVIPSILLVLVQPLALATPMLTCLKRLAGTFWQALGTGPIL